MDLSLDPVTIVFQVVNFLILAALLYRFLWKPVLQRIQARAHQQESVMREIEQDREEAARMRADLQARLERANEEADRVVIEAQEQAENARRKAMAEAEREVERILAEAHTEAHRVRHQAAEGFEEKALDAVLDVSGQLIQRVAPPEVHDALLREVTERIWEMGRTDIERVEEFRRSLGERTPTAHIATARALTAEQQGSLAQTFTALADRHVNVEIKVDPALAAGIRVRIGDLLIDNSIAGHMSQLRQDTMKTLEEQIAYG